MKRPILGFLLILLFCSHDMFLKMDSYFIEPNTEAVIQLYNGTFKKSDNVIARNRMLDVSLVGNGNRTQADSTQWYEKDSITFLKFNSGKEGTWVAGLSTAPRTIEMEAEAFNRYLKNDGVLDMLAYRTENNILNEAAVERYSKHVKTVFQVGEELSDDWNTVLGYPIEFVPLDNPYDIHPGHDLRVKLLLNGKPLSNHLVYVGHESSGNSYSHDDSAEHTHDDGTTHSHENDTTHSHDNEKAHSHETEHSHNDEGEHTHDDGTTHSHDTKPEHSHDTAAEHTHEDGTKHSHDETPETSEEHEHDPVTQLKTDDNGIATVNLSSTGVWFLRTIHMETLEEEGLTHESKWATLTFAIGEGHSHEHSEEAHDHEEAGIPSYLYWIGSLILVAILFFWFNRKK